jgi:hypothetical protein
MENYAPLRHADAASKSDEQLTKEADAFLQEHPPLQFVAECIDKLRELQVPWFSPERLREKFPARVRMMWLEQRPDLRQEITTKLTGLKAPLARKRDPERQAQDIDEAIGLVCTPQDFEEAFVSTQLVVYGDARAIFAFINAHMPWKEQTQQHRDFAYTALQSLLDPRGKKPRIMEHLEMRMTLDEFHLQKHLPPDIRSIANKARFKYEKENPGKPFTAEMEFEYLKLRLLTTHLELIEIRKVWDRGVEIMGLNTPLASKETSEEDALLSSNSRPTSLPTAEQAERLTRGQTPTQPPPALDGVIDVREEELLAAEMSKLEAELNPETIKPPPKASHGLPSNGSSHMPSKEEMAQRLEIIGVKLPQALVTNISQLHLFQVFTLFEKNTWPEKENDQQKMMIGFLNASDPKKLPLGRIETFGFKTLRTTFLTELSAMAPASLMADLAPKPVPPPLPSEAKRT